MLDELTRRDVLKLSLAAGALGVTAPFLPGCSSAFDRSSFPATLNQLNDLECAVMTRVAAVTLPPKGMGLPDYRDLPILENVDHFFGNMPPYVRDQLGDGVVLLEYGAILIGLHLRPFTRLNDEKAQAYLIGWGTGRRIQKAIYNAVTKIVVSAYWQEEATWEPVGYKGPLYKRSNIPSLGNTPLPQD